jgi:hypothetical protein
VWYRLPAKNRVSWPLLRPPLLLVLSRWPHVLSLELYCSSTDVPCSILHHRIKQAKQQRDVQQGQSLSLTWTLGCAGQRLSWLATVAVEQHLTAAWRRVLLDRRPVPLMLHGYVLLPMQTVQLANLHSISLRRMMPHSYSHWQDCSCPTTGGAALTCPCM